MGLVQESDPASVLWAGWVWVTWSGPFLLPELILGAGTTISPAYARALPAPFLAPSPCISFGPFQLAISILLSLACTPRRPCRGPAAIRIPLGRPES